MPYTDHDRQERCEADGQSHSSNLKQDSAADTAQNEADEMNYEEDRQTNESSVDICHTGKHPH
jgi:hypothetical protein